MSFNISLRRSPKPGALTAQTCSVPRSLFTTSVASASPSMSSAMMSNGRAALATSSSSGQQVLHAGESLLVHQDEAVLQHRLHALGVGHEVRRQIAAVELHPLDHLQRGLHGLRLLDGDHALLADLLHGLGQDVPDLAVAVGADGADLSDLGLVLGRLGLRLQIFDDLRDRGVDAALDVHGVVSGGHQLGALGVDGLGQHRRRRRAVSGDVGGLGRHLLHHLRAQVRQLVLELDLLGDRDAVLGDRRRAPGLLDEHVAAAWPQRHLDRVGQDVEPGGDALAGVPGKHDVLG